MKAELTVLLVSALLFIATEYFFPIEKDDATAAKQKHFLSIMLTIFSLVIGYDIKMSFDTQTRIEEVSTVFRKLADAQAESTLKDIYTEYDRNFTHAHAVLKGWAGAALNQLVKDMRNGYISIPRGEAAREIGNVYHYARENIVASNVGGTKFYFENQNYVRENKSAASRGVPIIRFYLWSSTQKIELTCTNQPIVPSKDLFFAEVKMLHTNLGSVYSAVIDMDKLSGSKARDLLILDNKFSAETDLSVKWEPIKAKATENPDNLTDARQYFRDLRGAVEKEYVVMMKDDEVKKQFSKKSASDLFDDIMNTVTSQY
jgi:hypothetical protein